MSIATESTRWTRQDLLKSLVQHAEYLLRTYDESYKKSGRLLGEAMTLVFAVVLIERTYKLDETVFNHPMAQNHAIKLRSRSRLFPKSQAIRKLSLARAKFDAKLINRQERNLPDYLSRRDVAAARFAMATCILLREAEITDSATSDDH